MKTGFCVRAACSAIVLASVFHACESDKPVPQEEPKIKSLNELSYTLPPGAGRELCERYCLTCHSLQYIEMQPGFPEKTWRSLVNKMVKTFGAPIPDSAVEPIVAYLVRIKGKRDSIQLVK
jgi:hypothetical protein